MPYRKTPSQMTWAEAFEDHRRYVNQSELTQQVINHLGGYTGETKYVDLPKEKQDQLYEILGQIL
jgi:hypothetical protein